MKYFIIAAIIVCCFLAYYAHRLSTNLKNSSTMILDKLNINLITCYNGVYLLNSKDDWQKISCEYIEPYSQSASIKYPNLYFYDIEEKIIKTVNLKSKQIKSLKVLEHSPFAIRVSPSETKISYSYAAENGNDYVSVMDLRRLEEKCYPLDDIIYVSWHPDEDKIVCSSQVKYFFIDLILGQISCGGEGNKAEYLSNNRIGYITYSCHQYMGCIKDLEKGILLKTFTLDGLPKSVAWLPDGRKVVLGFYEYKGLLRTDGIQLYLFDIGSMNSYKLPSIPFYTESLFLTDKGQ